eukprot:jgi/Botrbrau1/10857/Bobra.0025s0035.1
MKSINNQLICGALILQPGLSVFRVSGVRRQLLIASWLIILLAHAKLAMQCII